jgi:signal transduction histidine kinase
MRALIFELRPQMLAEEGLVAAVERLLGSLLARHRFEVHPTLGAEPDLDLDTKEALYRIVQECLNNVIRHAQAHVVGFSLTEQNRCVRIEVTDDGVGFDPSSSFPGHLGLTSMHERAVGIGATLVVDSAPGKGTRVSVELPT